MAAAAAEGVAEAAGQAPPEKVRLALLGGGMFARDTYVPILRQLRERVDLCAVWSRSESSATSILQRVQDWAPNASMHYGEDGLKTVLADRSIHAVAVVLPPQVQLLTSLFALQCGLAEKPFSKDVAEGRAALERYYTLSNPPIWSLAENYRFEPGLLKLALRLVPVDQQAAELVQSRGEMVMVEMVAESAMLADNKYFGSDWRRDSNYQGFVAEGGVHFIGGLRLVAGCKVTSVSASALHRSQELPPPDTVTALLQFSNTTSGTLAMTFAGRTRKVFIRIVLARGTVEVERLSSTAAWQVTELDESGNQVYQESFPYHGVYAEIEAFVNDVLAKLQAQTVGPQPLPNPAGTPEEGLQDVAVIEAMLRSSANGSTPQDVQFL
eukprot:jgi/Chlat1/4888/Chrsp31S04816